MSAFPASAGTVSVTPVTAPQITLPELNFEIERPGSLRSCGNAAEDERHQEPITAICRRRLQL